MHVSGTERSRVDADRPTWHHSDWQPCRVEASVLVARPAYGTGTCTVTSSPATTVTFCVPFTAGVTARLSTSATYSPGGIDSSVAFFAVQDCCVSFTLAVPR